MKMTLSVAIILLIVSQGISQIKFITVFGNKANYSITVPPTYFSMESVGANIDLKYVNSEGASIITIVKKPPAGMTESFIDQMLVPSDQDVVDELEASGMQNITVIKRGIITINGVRTYYSYYHDLNNYFHTICQIKNGKFINLTYTCDYSQKESYMPYIFRVTNSLKYF